MEFTVAVYERREKRFHEWWTLGLGERNCHRSGRHAGKLRDQLLGDLRKSLAKAGPTELERFQLPRGIELRHERLELRLGRGRRHTGRFPIVLAPYPTTASESLVAAYHPLRQDAWFPVDEERPLAEQAALFFQREWRHLDEEDLEHLAAVKHERLRLVSLNAHPKTLLDALPRKEEKSLVGGGAGVRRRGGRLSILPDVAVDETQSIVDEPPTARPRAAWRERLARQAGGGSPLVVVGEPGVGKSTLIRQWAADLLRDDGYGVHGNLDRCRHVWRVAGRRLIAGMSYVGQWEERALGLVEEAATHRVVLWIEDLHAFGHLGRTIESDRCLADVFHSAVARREIHVVGELTPAQLRILEDDVPAFAALFTRLPLERPSMEETLGLLIHEARHLELEYEVEFRPSLYRSLLETSESLLTTSSLPGKALELLRALARKEEGGARGALTIDTNSLLDLIARRTGIPQVLLDPEFPIDAQEVEDTLELSVVGQEAGVAAARDVILRMKTGLADPRRPYGVLLFTGPTGTGKTELAKALADYLYGGTSRLVRFDMSEYSGPDAAARLIGERGRPRGQLTTAVREQPFSVVLFDEIEKCHPSVLHLLLQIAGDGRLTDAAGDVADFTHTVVVLTSNLGASGRSRVGFDGAADAVAQEVLAAVKAHFPPELFNRIDRVVPFRPLDPTVARVIARRELERLLARRGLVERGIFVTATERVLDRVVTEGFNAEEGARSLKRYLDRHVGGPLAELIAGSAGAEMRRVSVHAADEGFGLYSEELREARPVEEASPLEPFLRRSVDNLRAELPRTLELVESLAQGPELAELAEKLRAHLREYRIGKTGLADRIYNLDALRGRLTELGEQLTRQIETAEPELGEQIELERFAVLTVHEESDCHGPHRFRVLDRRAFSDASQLADKAELLAILGEVHFLRLVLSRVEDMSRHAIFVELAHVGQAAARDRFAKRREGLLEWLSGFYGWTRGELESWAASYEDGARKDGVDHRSLSEALGRYPRRVVLKLAGLSVLDRFTGEHGCHLRTSLGGGTEIVRVAVSPAPPDVTAEAALTESEAARRRFVDALESGEKALPENPEELLPVVRRYNYEPTEDGTASRCEVEDYLLSHAAGHRVRYFGEVLSVLALLHQTVETP